jgi:hypothetical protein
MTAVVGSVPFREQNFQFARVTLDTTSRLCISVFYQTISLCCWAFSRYNYEYYSSLASYQRLCAECYWLAYMNFGDHLIDFCINEPISPPVYEKGIEALKKLYGDAIDEWSKLDSLNIPLLESLLTPKAFGSDDGCCAGISLDAIAESLKKIEQGMSPDDALKNLCGRYTYGAPPPAELAQIFLEALHPVGKKEQIDSFKQKYKENLSSLCEEAKLAIKSAKAAEKKKLLALNFIMKAKQLEEAFYNEVITIAADSSYEKIQLIAAKMGLSLYHQAQFHHDKPEASSSQLDQMIRNLPIGVYFIGLRSRIGAHALAYFKVDAKTHFIIEPNFAILQPPDSALDTLRDRIFAICPQESVYLVSFYRCSLQ